jgi:hypothetical protein
MSNRDRPGASGYRRSSGVKNSGDGLPEALEIEPNWASVSLVTD